MCMCMYVLDLFGCVCVCVCACVLQADIGRDNMLAHFAAPVLVLREGYRSCPLRNKLGKRIPFCNLLCLFATKPCASAPPSITAV
jgi:hypothetical protein